MAVTRRRLILVRHGQTPANCDGRLDTRPPGLGLTSLGVEQAGSVAARLVDEDISSVSASPLLRAQLTAVPLARERGLAVHPSPGAAEIEAGDLEMRHDDEAHLVYLQTGFAWAVGDLGRQMPGGGDGHGFFHRYDHAIEELDARTGTAVLISHGAAIRVWAAARATNIDAAYAADHPLGNTGHVTIEESRWGWEVLAWDSRLPAQSSAADPTGTSLSEVQTEVEGGR